MSTENNSSIIHIASDPRKGEFTPTSLETYLDCPRKYYFTKVMQLTPVKGVSSANFGTAIHAGVDIFYSLKNTGISHDELVARMLQAFALLWDRSLDDGRRNINSGIAILSAYARIYKNDTATYLRDLVESKITISMPNGTTLTMRLDRILVEGKFYTVVDTKTTSMSLTEYYLKNFVNSFQLTSYCYAVTQLKGHCDNVQVDAIKVPPEIDVGKGFVRRSMERTELQVEDWLNTYNNITEQIQSNFSLCSDEGEEIRAFYQNQNSCTKYGGCPFFSICQYGLSHPDVQLMFVRKNIEIPLD